MVKEVERDVFEMGIKVQSDTVQDRQVVDKEAMNLELNGYSYKLTSKNSLAEMLNYMNINQDWVHAEFGERVKDEYINPGEAWRFNKNLWEKYINKRSGFFSYTYNERIIQHNQLQKTIDELKQHPSTRQAIITIYETFNDIPNRGGIKRIPCSMYYQFLLRNGELNLFYTMRSCDFLKHFAGDVALALMLLDYVAEKIGCKIGTFTHFIGSLHAFYIDLEKRGIF